MLVQYAPVTDRVLAALPRIGLVSRYGAGFDTIDTDACRRHGVWVANSPDYGVGEVATHALAMTLALIRHLALYDRDVRAGNWHYLSPGTIRRASDMTVGILGLGRIGKRYAALARDCFARVIACDPYIIDGDFPAYRQARRRRQQLFEQADVVSLHVPLNDETRGMVGASLLARMKHGSFLVNTARGGIVDVDRGAGGAGRRHARRRRRSMFCRSSRSRRRARWRAIRARCCRRTRRFIRSRPKSNCAARRR